MFKGGRGSVRGLGFPKFLGVFRSGVATASALVLIFFKAVVTVLNRSFVHRVSDKFTRAATFPMCVLVRSLCFAMCLRVLGVNIGLFMNRLATSFGKVSSGLLPNTIPTMSYTITFGCTPKGTMAVKFLYKVMKRIVTVLKLVIFRSPIVVVVKFAAMFFSGTVVTVFTGGQNNMGTTVVVPFVYNLVRMLLNTIAM